MSGHAEAAKASGSARRVARNAIVRSVAEIIGKVATFAMFVAIARKLGPRGLGDITFAIALTGNLLIISGFGVDMIVTREAIRRPPLLGSLMGNALVIKLIGSAPALLVAAAVVEFGNYSGAARIAVYLIGLSTLIDVLENTWNAAFQTYERLEFMSAVIVFQRLVTGGLAVAVVAAGGGVVPVSGAFLLVSVATILLAMWLLRFVASPSWSVQRSRLLPLLRAGLPVGVAVMLLTVLLRVDMVILSLIAGNREVGIYGAAFRIVESTMFISWAFSSALFPWFSRMHVENRGQIARGYELGLVVLLSLLTPLGVGCALLAGPVVHLIYGGTFDASITPLRLLGAVVIAYGVNTLTSSTLAANNLPRLMHRILLVTLVQNVAMNLLLIPPYGAIGAGLSAAVSALLLSALSIRQAVKAFGQVDLTRIFLGPAVGGAAMSGAVALVWGSLIEGLLLGGAAYFAAMLLVERTFFPEDFARLLGAMRIRPGRV
jgi:O-antigen/teichoic acid export membrane protein